MKILIIEPYFEGSHKSWSLELQKFSSHTIELLTLPGRHWKWRMHGGAVTLAQKYNDLNFKTDLILTSDMLNLPLGEKSTTGMVVSYSFEYTGLNFLRSL